MFMQLICQKLEKNPAFLWLLTKKKNFSWFLKMINFLQFDFILTLLFSRKASKFAFFLPLVVEKWNFFPSNIFKYVFLFYVIGYVNIQSFHQIFSKVCTFPRLSYFSHRWFFNCMTFPLKYASISQKSLKSCF